MSIKRLLLKFLLTGRKNLQHYSETELSEVPGAQDRRPIVSTGHLSWGRKETHERYKEGTPGLCIFCIVLVYCGSSKIKWALK